MTTATLNAQPSAADYAVGTYLLYFRAGNDLTQHTVEFRLR